MTQIEASVIGCAAKAIMQADSLIIGAGAGMGVDSGLPDFRGQQGFWRAYPALADAGLDFTEIANPSAFAYSPKLAWGFYGHRYNLYRNTKPHEGFNLLKRIGDRLANGYQVFTSNVDGHFQAAGFAESRVYECHGSINYLQCSQPCSGEIWSASGLQITTDDIRCLATSELPRCPSCGEAARPNILMFDDYHWQDERAEVHGYQMRNHIKKMNSPVIIECGAGTNIPTVRYFCESQNGILIRINLRESQVARNESISLACSALEGLQLIDKTLTTLGFYSD